MPAREIISNIYSVGVVDWDRELFDALIPLPHGTSYNSYVVRGSEKTAIIDTVEPEKFDEYRANLLDLKLEKVDYIIANHAEQDHSGSIPELLKMFPEAKVVANAKCKGFLQELLGIEEEAFLVIKDRENLSLGNFTLEFIFAPWVHWPETMFTLVKEAKILFTCDLFGSHLATSDLFARELAWVLQEAKRYYAEIMMPYARQIRKYLDIVREINPEFIAPSHGPVYDDVELILSAYEEWVSEKPENEVVLLYVSMHGSTAKMASVLIDALVRRGVKVRPFNLTKADIGEMSLALVNAATLVVASPAVLAGPHPNMVTALYLINSLKPKLKFGAVIGSFSWANKLDAQVQEMLKNVKMEFLPPVISKGHPTEEIEKQLEELANQIVAAHSKMNL
ncbi:MAG: FprA family A-type flavoprotein [Calditrichia bacterium]